MKKVKTKDKIILAAIKCFGSKGIENTKIVDIADSLGIKHSLVLYHFKDFDDICYHVVKKIASAFALRTQKFEQKNYEKAELLLQSYVASHFEIAQKNPVHFSIWMYFYYKSFHDPKYLELLNSLRQQSLLQLRHILLQFFTQRGCEIREKRIEMLTEMILSTLVGSMILAFTQDSMDTSSYAQTTYQYILHSLLDDQKFFTVVNRHHSEQPSL